MITIGRKRKNRWARREAVIILLICFALPLASEAARADSPEGLKPALDMDLGIPGPKDDDDSGGGIIVADIDNDSKPDYLVTCRGYIVAFGNSGKKLWRLETDVRVDEQSESRGLPGHNGPGLSAGDVDGDGKAEVVFLTQDSTIHIVDGATGKEESRARPPVPKGAQRWEQAMIASLRGQGDDADILLQATNRKGYRTGRYLAAYSMRGLIDGEKPLWTVNDFAACAHNGARLADLDGDGRDEILGAMILGPDGKVRARPIPGRYHIDSVFVADVLPQRAGLEAVMLEEGSNRVQVLGIDGPIWRKHLRKQEPQNAAVGRFGPDGKAIYIWCRSRYSKHQKPFVFDANGKMVFEYAMDDLAPKGWTASGVEVIHTIDWTGDATQLACAKERHTSGDVGIFEPLTGRFVLRIRENAHRLYVFDTLGDWREEIIVQDGGRLRVYQNPAPNPNPNHPRLWKNRNYRRLKQCHNYYSP